MKTFEQYTSQLPSGIPLMLYLNHLLEADYFIKFHDRIYFSLDNDKYTTESELERNCVSSLVSEFDLEDVKYTLEGEQYNVYLTLKEIKKLEQLKDKLDEFDYDEYKEFEENEELGLL